MMMAGKRPRPPFRRTTSMIGITVDLEELPESEPPLGFEISPPRTQSPDFGSGTGPIDQSLMVSPRNHGRRNTNTNCIETAHFLRTCGLCQRRLAPANDIYMYRGDTAFCSLECREQEIKHDERKDKCSKEEYYHRHRNHHSARATSTDSGKRKTMAAAY